jgi:hypothetical protein
VETAGAGTDFGCRQIGGVAVEEEELHVAGMIAADGIRVSGTVIEAGPGAGSDSLGSYFGAM